MFPPVQESICESRESGTILSEHTPEMAVCVLTRGARNNSERTSYNTSPPSHTRLRERNPGQAGFEANCISMEHPTPDMTAADGFTASFESAEWFVRIEFRAAAEENRRL